MSDDLATQIHTACWWMRFTTSGREMAETHEFRVGEGYEKVLTTLMFYDIDDVMTVEFGHIRE